MGHVEELVVDNYPALKTEDSTTSSSSSTMPSVECDAAVETAVKDDASPPPPAVKEPRIVWFGIYRNEGAIIERALDSVKPIIDAVAALITGTEDDTGGIISAWCLRHNVPCSVKHEPFVNFGVSRSRSLVLAHEAFPDYEYGLTSDADMILVVGPEFKKTDLVDEGYSLYQDVGDTKYPNMRIMRLDAGWTCVGRTHEYFKSPTDRFAALYEHLWFDDRNDGKFKSDKFERDVRLLTEQWADPTEPHDLNMRAAYYLAQSYWGMRKYEETIAWANKRIELGGFPEEVYQAWCHKARSYNGMADRHPAKSEKHIDLKARALYEFLSAWSNRPTRIEALYGACRLLREAGLNAPSFALSMVGKSTPIPKDHLFVETKTHLYSFTEEISITAYYLPDKREIGKRCCEQLIKWGPTLLGEGTYRLALNNAKFYQIDVPSVLAADIKAKMGKAIAANGNTGGEETKVPTSAS